MRQDIRTTLDQFAKDVSRILSTNEAVDHLQVGENAQEYAKSIRASTDIGNRKRRHSALEKELRRFFNDKTKARLEIPIRPIQEGLFENDSEEE